MQQSSSKNQGFFCIGPSRNLQGRYTFITLNTTKQNLEELGLDSHARHGYHSSQYIWGHPTKIVNFHRQTRLYNCMCINPRGGCQIRGRREITTKNVARSKCRAPRSGYRRARGTTSCSYIDDTNIPLFPQPIESETSAKKAFEFPVDPGVLTPFCWDYQFQGNLETGQYPGRNLESNSLEPR